VGQHQIRDLISVALFVQIPNLASVCFSAACIFLIDVGRFVRFLRGRHRGQGVGFIAQQAATRETDTIRKSRTRPAQGGYPLNFAEKHQFKSRETSNASQVQRQPRLRRGSVLRDAVSGVAANSSKFHDLEQYVCIVVNFAKFCGYSLWASSNGWSLPDVVCSVELFSMVFSFRTTERTVPSIIRFVFGS
jgi:hypothetical protein